MHVPLLTYVHDLMHGSVHLPLTRHRDKLYTFSYQFILDDVWKILYIFSGMLVLDMIISILNKGRLYVSLNVLF